MKAETQRWVKIADGDLTMAGIAQDRALYNQCIFHCQQALEKLLKAIWVERSDRAHPRTHQLASLALQLELDMSSHHLNFLQRLADQYLPSHYADFEIEYSEEVATYYFQAAQEIYQWLRLQLN